MASSWFSKLTAELTAPQSASPIQPQTAEEIAQVRLREEEAAVAQRRLQITKTRLKTFYKQWNPSKLSEVGKLAKQFQGREVALWRTLKHKYVDRAQLPDGSLQREKDENIFTFILVLREKRVPEVIARRVHDYSRNLHFWDYSGLRRPEDYFEETTFRNRDRSLQIMLNYQSNNNALKKSLIDLGIHHHKGRVVDMGTSPEVDETARRMFRNLCIYMRVGITLKDRKKSSWVDQQRTSTQGFRSFVRLCIISPLMIDEAFMQVMKQLKGNSNATSVYRGWQILVLLCGCMLPAKWFRRFVRHFLQTSLDDALNALLKYKNDISISASRIRFSQITSAYARFALGVYKRGCTAHTNTTEAHMYDESLASNQERVMSMQRAMPMTVHVVLPDRSNVCRMLVWPDQIVENVTVVALQNLKCKQCEFVKYGLALNPRQSLSERHELKKERDKNTNSGMKSSATRTFKTLRHYTITPTDTISQRRILLNSVTPGSVLQWIAAPHLEMSAGCIETVGLPLSDSEVMAPFAQNLLLSRDAYDEYVFSNAPMRDRRAAMFAKIDPESRRYRHQDYVEMANREALYSEPQELKELHENVRDDMLDCIFQNGELELELVQRHLCTDFADPYSEYFGSESHQPSAGCCCSPTTRYIQYLQCLDDVTCGRIPLEESDAGLAAALAMEIDRRLEPTGIPYKVTISKTMNAARSYVAPRLLSRHPLPAWSRKITSAHRRVLQGIDAEGHTLGAMGRGKSKWYDGGSWQAFAPPPPIYRTSSVGKKLIRGSPPPRLRGKPPPPPPTSPATAARLASVANNRFRRACRKLGIETCPPEELVMSHKNLMSMRDGNRRDPHFICEFNIGQLGLNIDVTNGCVLYIQEGTQASRWPCLSEGDFIVSVQGEVILDPSMIVSQIQRADRPVSIGFRKSDEYLWRDHAPRPLLATLLDRFIKLLKRNRLFGAHLFPCLLQSGCMEELNRRFRVQETPTQLIMVGVNNGGIHFWDVQRGLIETLDFCELVSWGQTRHHDWSANIAAGEDPIQKKRNVELSHLSGFGTILTSGLQMQTLRINVAILLPPLIRRNQRVVMTDAFDKVAGRVVRADRIARARQAKALKRRYREQLESESRRRGETITANSAGETKQSSSGPKLRSTKPEPSGRSLVKLLHEMTVHHETGCHTADDDHLDGEHTNYDDDIIVHVPRVAAAGGVFNEEEEEMRLNEDNAMYYNHYDEDSDDEYAYEEESHVSYGNRIPHQISIKSTGIHILASLMLNVINGIMAAKGYTAKGTMK